MVSFGILDASKRVAHPVFAQDAVTPPLRRQVGPVTERRLKIAAQTLTPMPHTFPKTAQSALFVGQDGMLRAGC
jgi:hypothetical protein